MDIILHNVVLIFSHSLSLYDRFQPLDPGKPEHDSGDGWMDFQSTPLQYLMHY